MTMLFCFARLIVPGSRAPPFFLPLALPPFGIPTRPASTAGNSVPACEYPSRSDQIRSAQWSSQGPILSVGAGCVNPVTRRRIAPLVRCFWLPTRAAETLDAPRRLVGVIRNESVRHSLVGSATRSRRERSRYMKTPPTPSPSAFDAAVSVVVSHRLRSDLGGQIVRPFAFDARRVRRVSMFPTRALRRCVSKVPALPGDCCNSCVKRLSRCSPGTGFR